jgi:NDP-sugar pyrophosphorylase family protein
LRATAEGCILERAMNDISALPEEAYGLGFVPARFLGAGEDEYRIRDEQLAGIGRSPGSYRPLRPYELETLVKNGNTSPDWGKVLVSAYFTPELVKNSEFAGLVRLGRLAPLVLEHHDLRVPVGITRSRIIACDIGDDCAVHDCSYLAHYIIGDGCILMSNDEIQASNHVKFGNGVVMEGEPEEVRVQLDLMNEAGGRSVLPFEDMTCADAYLWARRRGDSRLMEAFKAMTDASFDRRRGRYGTVGRSSVLKSNCIIKDAAIGECAYVKGANKIKNVTIRSSEAERTQIGEGVELVNGIVGYGCRVFYGSKAVRFVMGPNSALKYGARLIHSVLGDNSTVSCCEILNNLIFPAHEQHHNTSFLIASLVRGQSNMAAGATIGSNHNSRSNDGEIEAGRGFWPGLSTSVKHSSRFASYCLLSKGDYRFELDIPLPFCLVDDDRSRDRLVLVPAYWWSHNLYALMRNESKFLSRDKRVQKIQSVEFSPFAPDTAEEIIAAIGLLEEWCGTGKLDGIEELPGIEIPASRIENSSRPVLVVKPRRARTAYREMLLWYAAREVLAWAESADPELSGGALAARVAEALAPTLPQERPHLHPPERAPESRVRGGVWENLGGQLVPLEKVDRLVERIDRGEIADWQGVHAEYALLAREYPLDKARNAFACLLYLFPGREAPLDLLREALGRLAPLVDRVEEGILSSRRKDHANPFRRATFRSEEEVAAVMGKPEDNAFVKRTRGDMAGLRERCGLLSMRLNA